MWTDCHNLLSNSSLTSLIRSMWEFLQRVVSDCADTLEPLNQTTKKCFFTAVLEESVADAEETLFTNVGLYGFINPPKTASSTYQTSRQGTNMLVEAVKRVEAVYPAEHTEIFWVARKQHVKSKERVIPILLESIVMQFIPKHHRASRSAIHDKSLSGYCSSTH